MEAGGTKFVCAVGTGPDDIRARVRIPTTTPDETLAQVVSFFRSQGEAVSAVGIGAFGPLDRAPASPTFGFITSTPKPGWSQCDIAGRLRTALNARVAIDTDVNAAAIAEHRWGAARGAGTVLYVTFGTGIGGGVLVNGLPLLSGAIPCHPERSEGSACERTRGREDERTRGREDERT